MEQNMDVKTGQQRRKFLAGFLASVVGVTAWLLAPKRARAAGNKLAAAATGPILYHRTEETERYYRTLFNR